MPTPSIQTLVTDAQQILNLDSISAVRSVVAVALANANTGTPLNPNLTTQQLWNEFYQVVNKPKSDIESIIANQLMKLLYAPPAPGGAGANKQVIFNDGGVLAGDAGFTYDKATDTATLGNRLLIGVSNAATVGNPVIAAVGGSTYDGQFSLIGNFTNDNTSAGKGVLIGFNNTTNNGIIAAAYGNGTEGLQFWTHNGSGWGSRMELSASGNLSTFGSGNGANLNVTTASQVCGLRLRQTQNVHPATRNWTIFTNGSAYGLLEFGVGAAQFSDSYTSVMTVDGVGNVTPVGNVVMGTSGKGIDFSATASGSGTMTSELFNDYEEGTFTATLKGVTTDPTTPVTTTGRYTKIGRTVYAQIEFSNVDTTGASGGIFVNGLPFVSLSGASSGSVGAAMVDRMATFTNSSLSAYIGGGQNYVNLYVSTSNGAVVLATHNAGTGRYLWFGITYNV